MHYLLLIPALVLSLLSTPAGAEDTFQPYDAERFEAAREAGGPVVVHVHAFWCSVCRRQVRVLDEFLQTSGVERIPVFRVNYDREREFLSGYGVRRQANILVFRDGREVSRVDYSADAAEIRAALAMAHP